MIIIHTLARMCGCCCRRRRSCRCCCDWALHTIVLLYMFNQIEMVKYAPPPSASAIAPNNNNFRNDSRLLVSHFEQRTPPVNTMPMYVHNTTHTFLSLITVTNACTAQHSTRTCILYLCISVPILYNIYLHSTCICTSCSHYDLFAG